MKFVVTVLRRAQADADLIFQWIAERSPDGAIRWSRAYDHSLMELRRDADWQGLAAESDELHTELREKLFKT